jgi:excisionase family DNA binding protein
MLLTAEQLAARWQVPRSHVYRLAREGQLPVVRLGRYRRFELAAIEEFEHAGGCKVDTLARAA